MKTLEKQFVNEVTKLLKGEDCNKTKIIDLSKRITFDTDMARLIYNRIPYIIDYIYAISTKTKITEGCRDLFNFRGTKIAVTYGNLNKPVAVIKVIGVLCIIDSDYEIYEAILKSACPNFNAIEHINEYRKDNLIQANVNTYAVFIRAASLYGFDLEVAGPHLKRDHAKMIKLDDTFESLKDNYIKGNITARNAIAKEVKNQGLSESQIAEPVISEKNVKDAELEGIDKLEALELEKEQVKSLEDHIAKFEPVKTSKLASVLRSYATDYIESYIKSAFDYLVAKAEEAAKNGALDIELEYYFEIESDFKNMPEKIVEAFEQEDIVCIAEPVDDIKTVKFTLKW